MIYFMFLKDPIDVRKNYKEARLEAGRQVKKVLSDVSDSKESICNVEDSGSIPRLGRSPGEGNGYPLQCSCLENSMDRVHGITVRCD